MKPVEEICKLLVQSYNPEMKIGEASSVTIVNEMVQFQYTFCAEQKKLNDAEFSDYVGITDIIPHRFDGGTFQAAIERWETTTFRFIIKDFLKFWTENTNDVDEILNWIDKNLN